MKYFKKKKKDETFYSIKLIEKMNWFPQKYYFFLLKNIYLKNSNNNKKSLPLLKHIYLFQQIFCINKPYIFSNK